MSCLTRLFAGALCLLCFSSVVRATTPEFFVVGEVYCEVCRINFINKLSEPMPGAKVKLECRGEETGNITYTQEGVTNEAGQYRLKVEGDHEEEECGITLVKSGRADCDEIPNEGWASKPSSLITLTKNNGFHGSSRYANPLGFTKKKANHECAELIKELEIDPDHP
ncbi:major pollen allergen Ole e 1-like [Sesamum indicum]|uniref:Major pollen allergen Ole e 1-like n=1 Tax=Sesamum indicum TaxID=4182 RepID=A0A6I9TDH9_SESIN|nr:major pollen allergen Ole e 1-like [Sesamum indicum]